MFYRSGLTLLWFVHLSGLTLLWFVYLSAIYPVLRSYNEPTTNLQITTSTNTPKKAVTMAARFIVGLLAFCRCLVEL